MALNEFNLVDYLAEARDRVTSQFFEKPVFDAFLRTLIAERVDVQEQIRKLMQERSIDTAVGFQLDIIGNIVGQSRFVPDINPIPFFAFDGYVGGGGFVANPLDPTAVKFKSVGQSALSNEPLQDEDFRRAIRARIIKNSSKGTIEDILEAINVLVPVDNVSTGDMRSNLDFNFLNQNYNSQYIIEPHFVDENTIGDLPSYTLTLSRPLTTTERRLVEGKYFEGSNDTLMPKPVAVKQYVEEPI